MTQIVIDDPLLHRLREVHDSCFLVDSSGNTVGTFVPNTDSSFYQGHECPLTKEELDEIEREGGGRPLAEILRDLEGQT